MWLIISAIVRVILVVFVIGTATTFFHRVQHGFTETNPAHRYVFGLVIAGTLLYIFHTILPM